MESVWKERYAELYGKNDKDHKNSDDASSNYGCSDDQSFDAYNESTCDDVIVEAINMIVV